MKHNTITRSIDNEYSDWLRLFLIIQFNTIIIYRAKKKTVEGEDADFNPDDIKKEVTEEDSENKPLKKKRKRRAKAEPGYGPAPEKKIYKCPYCDFSAKKADWVQHLKTDHADLNLVRFQPLKNQTHA